jgi:hypothetical protein
MSSFGLIVARMDPPPELEEEFNAWYESEHLRERLRVPGFVTARRFVRDSAPRYVACYDLESLSVLQSDDYRAVSGDHRSPWTARMLRKTRLFSRRVYDQVFPGGQATPTDHGFAVLRTVRGDRAPLERHAAEAAKWPGVCARLFIGRVPADAEGEWLLFYSAANAEAAQRCAAADLGGDVLSFGPYSSTPREDQRYTQIPHSAREAMDAFYRRGYTDGLPIIPPTDELVQQMLAAQPRAASEQLGPMPPRLGVATLEAVAINAVMAGCHPRHFPVVVAAVEALLDPKFNLLGMQATTHPCTPLLVVSGPIRPAIGLCLAGNAMGEGTHANATIGRAVRLILRNIGGARPGKTDFATQGTPARYSFVLAENEEISPFPPLHCALGFAREQSVVTVFAAEGPHNINDHSSNCAQSLLEMIAGTMATLATNDLARGGKPILALGPEHAEMLARESYTRERIQAYLFEHARVRLEALPREMRVWLEERHDINRTVWNGNGVPIADDPRDIFVLVAGGRGRHSAYVPNFAFGRPISRLIPFVPTGEPPPVQPECDC